MKPFNIIRNTLFIACLMHGTSAFALSSTCFFGAKPPGHLGPDPTFVSSVTLEGTALEAASNVLVIRTNFFAFEIPAFVGPTYNTVALVNQTVNFRDNPYNELYDAFFEWHASIVLSWPTQINLSLEISECETDSGIVAIDIWP